MKLSSAASLLVSIRMVLTHSQAQRAYKKAAFLAPSDLSPVSNLSAVLCEMGDYQGAITYIREAMSLKPSDTNDDAQNDKLSARLAKCFLYLLEFSSAEDALSGMSSSQLRAELCESVKSMMALWAKVPDESLLRKQVLEQLGFYKPCLYVDTHSSEIRLLIRTQVKTYRNISALATTRQNP